MRLTAEATRELRAAVEVILEESDLTPGGLARQAGVSPFTVRRLLCGKTLFVSQSVADRLDEWAGGMLLERAA